MLSMELGGELSWGLGAVCSWNSAGSRRLRSGAYCRCAAHALPSVPCRLDDCPLAHRAGRLWVCEGAAALDLGINRPAQPLNVKALEVHWCGSALWGTHVTCPQACIWTFPVGASAEWRALNAAVAVLGVSLTALFRQPSSQVHKEVCSGQVNWDLWAVVAPARIIEVLLASMRRSLVWDLGADLCGCAYR